MRKPAASPPFALDEAGANWVETTLASLSMEDKLRQLFNLASFGDNEQEADALCAFRPGSITRFGAGAPEQEARHIERVNNACPTPLLIAADLEGSRMSLAHGGEWPNPLALAAIDDVETTREVSRIMAQEARAIGINWSFTPVLDINAAWRSAIVATRSFGADVSVIKRHALAQLTAFQEGGIACAVKHWPGEGYDDRDQHLVTTINPLSVDVWEASFGRLYRSAINAGALSVMSAHIAFPAFARQCGVVDELEAHKPGSISALINQKLLRERLGFGGLIVSDATLMAGLASWSPRAHHIPELIASGCDVILFSPDPQADLGHLKTALDKGVLTEARVDDAVLRQLQMKAAVGLHGPQQVPAPPDKDESQKFAAQVARRAPTLVKDVAKTLPITPDLHRRVLIFSGGITLPTVPHPMPFDLPDMLGADGFEVTQYEPGMTVEPDAFDLVLYLLGDETLLTRGCIFMDWLGLTGDFVSAMKRYWHDTPCVLISFGYPYMLYDAPRMPTYINAYGTSETVQRAVCDLLQGKGAWNHNSPVDPFCGLPDAHF